MEQTSKRRILPSARWTSFEDWNYNGLKERLETALAGINKDVLLSHVELLTGQRLSMSENLSAGDHWICFEMVADDGTLLIARVRLPRHPNTPPTVSEEDEAYAISCEVATMQFVGQKNLPSVVVPKVYAYEGPGTRRAAAAGATYMLLEGFYGNTLRDLAWTVCDLPVATQDHIITQWTMAQAQLATLAYPKIGSINTITESGQPVIGKLSTAAAEGLDPQGPFSTTNEYFTALGQAALRRAELQEHERNQDLASFSRLGAFVFLDIVQTTGLFSSSQDSFPVNHMDLGPQNIIFDDEFNLLGIIDWELTQTAPLQVNYCPFPFSLLYPDSEVQTALGDPTHIAHESTVSHHSTHRLYCQKFREAEIKLSLEGLLKGSFAKVLEGSASKVYGCFDSLGIDAENDPYHVRNMVRLAFGFDDEGTDRYIKKMVQLAFGFDDEGTNRDFQNMQSLI